MRRHPAIRRFSAGFARSIQRSWKARSPGAIGRIGSLCLVLLCGVAAASAVAAPGSDRLQVQSISIAPGGSATQVELRLSRPAAHYNLFTLDNPDRVVIDISTAAMGRTALPLPGGAGIIRDIRAAHRPGGNLRIVFDVATAVKPEINQKTDGSNPRLLIKLPSAGLASGPMASNAAGSMTGKAAGNTPGPGVTAPPTSVQSAAAAPIAVPPTVAPSTTESPPALSAPAPRAPAPASPPAGELARPLVIVVDAGHGGHDPGAHGQSGTLEKDVTLAISRRLVAQLNAQPGMRGVLTRSDDRYLGLRERMEKARSANANLFISVHADAAYNRSAQGSTVYVLSDKAASDEASRRLAARENAALIGGVELGDKDPVLASVLMDLSQNASISSSIAVGNAILRQMDKLGPLHRTTVQQAPFMVLKSPDVPSVLVETAYISNRTDERNLRSPAHQDQLAAAILAGVRRYFEANPPNGRPASMMASNAGTLSSTQVVIQRGDTLSDIANRYNVSVASLRAANALRSDMVRVGQTLQIPAAL